MRGDEKKSRKSNCSGQECGYGKRGFSRSRSLGIMVLVCGLLLFQISVFVLEKSGKGKVAEESEVSGTRVAGKDSVLKIQENGKVHELFCFDPNIVSPDSLCLLGFSPKQAQSIVKYRDKGGRFRKKEDFARMYVVSGQMYEKLSGYITIRSEVEKGSVLRHKTYLENGPKELLGREKKSLPHKKQAAAPERGAPRVELNSADSAALVSLYGIGGYYAKKIMAYRNRLGNFYAPEQLMEIDGIDSVRFDGFSKRVFADPSLVKRFSFDTAGKYFLMKHPYIGAYAARGILLMREKFGIEACNLENLVKERIISEETAKKLWYYVE